MYGVVGGELIVIAYSNIKQEIEKRLLGLQVDALYRIIAPQLVYYVNTICIEIILVYKLRNIYFFNRVIAKGLALLRYISRGLYRLLAAFKDIGLTQQYITLAALQYGIKGDIRTIINYRYKQNDLGVSLGKLHYRTTFGQLYIERTLRNLGNIDQFKVSK